MCGYAHLATCRQKGVFEQLPKSNNWELLLQNTNSFPLRARELLQQMMQNGGHFENVVALHLFSTLLHVTAAFKAREVVLLLILTLKTNMIRQRFPFLSNNVTYLLPSSPKQYHIVAIVQVLASREQHNLCCKGHRSNNIVATNTYALLSGCHFAPVSLLLQRSFPTIACCYTQHTPFWWCSEGKLNWHFKLTTTKLVFLSLDHHKMKQHHTMIAKSRWIWAATSDVAIHQPSEQDETT